MMKKNKILLFRHLVFWKIMTPIAFIIAKIKGYKVKSRLKMKKGDSYIILSNHQTGLDGIFLGLSFSRPYTALVTDSFFSSTASKFANYMFSLIPKKKGSLDIRCTMDMMKVIKEGGSLAFYPEGNRSYAEFQFPFTDRFGEFIRVFNKPIVIFNSCGGFGVEPRFARKRRKGAYYGEIKRIIEPNEYKDLSNEEFEIMIKDNLRVIDAESGEKYKSNCRAEYLERMFFVCPKCGKLQTLHSKGNNLLCSNCGLSVEYTEDLKLKSADNEFKFIKLLDWYNYQINFVKNFVISNECIFKDEKVKLYISNPYEKRKLISNGSMILNKDKIMFESGYEILTKDIVIASPVNGFDLTLTTSDCNFLIRGNDRFNALKYVLFFNKLDTKMKETNGDIYYPLVER